MGNAITRDFDLMMGTARLVEYIPSMKRLRLRDSLRQFAAPLREQVGRFCAHEAYYTLDRFALAVTSLRGAEIPLPRWRTRILRRMCRYCSERRLPKEDISSLRPSGLPRKHTNKVLAGCAQAAASPSNGAMHGSISSVCARVRRIHHNEMQPV